MLEQINFTKQPNKSKWTKLDINFDINGNSKRVISDNFLMTSDIKRYLYRETNSKKIHLLTISVKNNHIYYYELETFRNNKRIQFRTLKQKQILELIGNEIDPLHIIETMLNTMTQKNDDYTILYH